MQARSAWSDSGSFLDTEEMYGRALDLDWGRALRAHGLAAFILKHSGVGADDEGRSARDGPQSAEGEDLERQEIWEVRAVLWEHHTLIYKTFDAYSSVGSADFSHVSNNAYQKFVEDAKLSDKRSKSCNKTSLDQLFLMVNQVERKNIKPKAENALRGAAPSSPGKAPKLTKEQQEEQALNEADYDTRALNRMEWLQCLVRIAIMKFIIGGQMTNVAEAVRKLFEEHLEPNLAGGGPSSFDANDFRQNACYQEETDAVLVEFMPSIRALFAVAAATDNYDVANKAASEVLSFQEWMRMMKVFDLIDQEFTVREASLAFLWSRMRVVDDTSKHSKLRLENLSLEDFYEALIHVALMKALPTDWEIEEAGMDDAGEFILRMRETNASEFRKWSLENAARCAQVESGPPSPS